MKKVISLLLSAFIGISTLSFGQAALVASDIKTMLFELPDVIFEEVEQKDKSLRFFNIQIKQPIDHKNPSKGHFYQHLFLKHRGFDRPVLMNTNGYSLGSGPTELEDLTRSNYISIEHRFFGSSKPDSLQWEYLNLEQATADLHKINMLFKTIYKKNKWISSGISKGGQTTIYYKYFYPNDVDICIPYVAPLNNAYEDTRIYDFLDNVGDSACRQKILAYQKKMLKDKKELLPLLYWFAKGNGFTFNYLGGIEAAYEYAILEYPFSFWQWGGKCSDIPKASDDSETHINHFIKIIGLSFYSDKSMDTYAAHYYQATTQMGYYAYETEDFKGLLTALPMQPHPHASFVPKGIKASYNPEFNKKVHKWLETNGNNFLYIYGELDTWTATGVEPSKKTNAKRYVLLGKHHGNARIVEMNNAMKKDFINTLSLLLGEQLLNSKE